MGAPADEQSQPEASTSQQPQSNGAPAGPPAAGQAGARKSMKEMTKGQFEPRGRA